MRKSRRSNRIAWLLVLLAWLLLGGTWWPGSLQTTSLTSSIPTGLRLSVRSPTRWLWGRPALITLRIERAEVPTPSLLKNGPSPSPREGGVAPPASLPKQPQLPRSASSRGERLRLQARLEVNGALGLPSGPQTVVLGHQGSAVTLVWRLSASTPQPYQGRLWVQIASANTPTSWLPLAVVPLRGAPLAPAGCSVTCLRLVACSILALAFLLLALGPKR